MFTGCVVISLMGMVNSSVALQSSNYDRFTSASINSTGVTNQGVSNDGAVRISIPLTSFSTDVYQVPVSLSYYSSGMLLNQESSVVGHNWSLLAGGMISREIRDEPDKVNSPVGMPESLNPNDSSDLSFIHSSADDENFDSEPDLFSFSFAGHQGSFVLKSDGEFMPIPFQNIQIESNISMSELTITTDQGIKYYFGITANAHQQIGGEITAWYLEKVELLNGQLIQFEYEAVSVKYQSAPSHTVKSPFNLDSGCNTLTFRTASEHYSVIEVYTSRIISEGFGELLFEYVSDEWQQRLNRLISINNKEEIISEVQLSYQKEGDRTFLSGVKYLDSEGADSGDYIMTYYEADTLPDLDSFAQDHWGYYNGAVYNDSNKWLVPKPSMFGDVNKAIILGTDGADRSPNGVYAQIGMLHTITYPYGKTVEYFYESNEVREETVVYDPPSWLSRGRLSSNINQGSKSVVYPSFYDQEIKISLSSSGGCDAGPIGVVKVFDLVAQEYVAGLSNYSVQSDDTINFDAQKGKYYELVYTGSNSCNLEVEYIDKRSQSTSLQEKNVIVGGMRIKKIIEKDPLPEKNKTTRYYYGSKENIAVSSGVRFEKYSYDSYLSRYTAENGCEYYVLSSSPKSTAHGSGNGGVQYRNITISDGGDAFENGGIEYEYRIGENQPPIKLLEDTISIIGTPWTNTGWERGVLRSEEVFSNTLKVLNRKTYHYDLLSHWSDIIPAYVINKVDEGVYQAHAYQYHSYLSYLKLLVTENFDEEGGNPITSTTSYFHESTEHPYRTSVETLNSEGQQMRSWVKYPQDYDLTGTLIGRMLADHIVSTPIERFIQKDGAVVSASATAYEYDADYDYFAFKETYVAVANDADLTESTDAELFQAPYEWQLRVLKRDDQGHVISQISRAGIPTTFIRGYGGKYVVATVVNAGYDEVKSLLADNENLRLDEGLSSQKNDLLRSELPHARITCYTYHDGIGMTSSQDPNGRMSYYTYDASGRPKHIKDHEGHVRATKSYYIK